MTIDTYFSDPSSGFKSSKAWKCAAISILLASTASADQFGDFTYTDNGTSITITGYPAGATGAVVIPDTIVSKPVTSIGSMAFINCAGVTGVTIPSGVTTIGSKAFYNCAGITGVTIPSSVTTIGPDAFSFCISLTGITIPSGVTTIGNSAFFRCAAMTNVTIPPTVTAMGTQAFGYCSGLTNVVVPSSVTVIQGGTFFSCSGLVSVTLPNTITAIGLQAFQFCSALTSVTIPTGMTTLTSKVFANCRSLTTVHIPAGISSINVASFAECTLLTTFTVDAANSNYNSLGGFLTNKGRTLLVTAPGGLAGNVSIPAGLTDIATQAFRYCGSLTGVVFHSGVASIGSQAFSTCGKLTQAVFLGNAPIMASNAFELADPGFTIFYISSSSGFSSPTWMDYPAVETDPANVVGQWLISHGQPYNSPLASDPNGDGVSLLTAYALNLDPSTNLAGSMPKPVFSGGQVSLSFYAGTPGVTYTVEASENMTNWSIQGVVIGAPDANQIRKATADATGSGRFLRLVTSY